MAIAYENFSKVKCEQKDYKRGQKRNKCEQYLARK